MCLQIIDDFVLSLSRKTIQVLKVRVFNAINPNNSAILEIRNAKKNDYDHLREHAFVQISDIQPQAYHCGRLYLSIIKKIKRDYKILQNMYTNEETSPFRNLYRKIISYKDIPLNKIKSLDYEIDVCGLIVRIAYNRETNSKIVYLANEEKNIVYIEIWKSLQIHHDDILQKGRCITASNVKINQVFTNTNDFYHLLAERDSCFYEVPYTNLGKAMEEINIDKFIEECNEKIDNELNPVMEVLYDCNENQNFYTLTENKSTIMLYVNKIIQTRKSSKKKKKEIHVK